MTMAEKCQRLWPSSCWPAAASCSWASLSFQIVEFRSGSIRIGGRATTTSMMMMMMLMMMILDGYRRTENSYR